jgi:Reverse transcriptase (RNA-dependent DNA polymerase)/RNase H-like domain found in reverse transcriptase/Integrase zinc binding domain/Integrase core domain
LPPNYPLQPYFGQLTAANKSLLTTLGIATCNVNIFDLNIPTDFIVVSGVDFQCILGNTFLYKSQIKICFDTMTLTQGNQVEKINLNNITEITQNSLDFSELPHENNTADTEIPDFILYCAHDITLLPNQASYVTVKTNDIIPNGHIAVNFSHKLQSNFINQNVGYLTTWSNETNNTLYIKNDSCFVQTIRENQKVAFAFVPISIETADLHSIQQQESYDFQSSLEQNIQMAYGANQSTYDKIFKIEEIPQTDSNSHKKIDICPTLDDNQKLQLEELLKEFNDIIYWSIADYSVANIKPVSFTLKDDTTPFRNRAFRYSYSEKAAIEKLVDELLSCGVLEHSESPYSSNFFVVSKKDGTYRPIADLRALNKSLNYIHYPTPFIDELLYFMQSSRIFSTCDLASAFHIIPIAEECRQFTAVQTHIGHFQFKVLPQGLAISPSLFQKVMYENFGFLIPKCLILYFDDACVHAPDFPTMMENLRQFFTKLRGLNIKLKYNKCHFGYTTVSLLGFQISEKGISPCPRKVEVIKNLEIPRTLKMLRGFYGMASYYRRHQKNFASRTHCLTQLLRKDAEFKITREHIAAIEDIKSGLSEVAYLTHYEPHKPLRLETDGSCRGISASIHINKEGSFVPFSFASRALTESERRLAPIHFELLAICFGFKQFRQYLLDSSTEIEVLTDCAPLQSIFSASYKGKLSPQLLRLCLQLQGYRFTIKSRSGASNLAADYFSRYPPPTLSAPAAAPRAAEQHSNAHLLAIEELNFNEEQRKDPNLARIIDALSGAACETKVARKARAYSLDNTTKILYKKNYTNHGEKRLAVVPTQLIPRILTHFHDEPMQGAHTGIFRTAKKISAKFYFDNLTKIVTDFCNSCRECQERKRPIRPRQGFLQPTIHKGPFNTMQLDIFGPVQKTGLFHLKYVHIAICVTTKFVYMLPTKTCTAEATADFIMKIVCTFGLVEHLVVDGGSNFVADLTKELTNRLGINLDVSTAYHPQTIGANERMHGPLANYLSSYLNNCDALWPKYIRAAQLALNCSPSTATQFSPYYLVFGIHPRSPLENNWNLPAQYDTTEKWMENLKKARDLCISNLNKINVKMSEKYNKGRVSPDYKIGQLVMIKFPQNVAGRTDKFVRKFRGPYRVTEKLSPLNYMVARIINGTIKSYKVHVVRMKKYHGRPTYLVTPRVKIIGKKSKLYFLDY